MTSGQRYIMMSPEQLRDAIWCTELEEIFLATGSEVLFEEDDASVQVKLHCQGKTWFRYRLRDRRFDGPGWRATPQIDWDYSGERDVFLLGSAVEESVYCLDPRYSVRDFFSEDIAAFIKNPFEALPFANPTRERLDGWLEQWKMVISSPHILYPGYFFARNVKNVRRQINKNICKVLGGFGYLYLTAVPTWWHVASICEYLGFSYMFEEDKVKMQRITNVLVPFQDGSERGRRRLSWIMMLQFFCELSESSGHVPENFDLDKKYILRDADGNLVTFPLTPNKNLWMFHGVEK